MTTAKTAAKDVVAKKKAAKKTTVKAATVQPSAPAAVKTQPQEPVAGYSQRVRIRVRAYDHTLIDQAARTIMETAERSGAKTAGPVPLPTEKRRYTVLRSTFKHKDAREQYEKRVHKRLIDILEPTSDTIQALTNLSLPSGVEVEIKM